MKNKILSRGFVGGFGLFVFGAALSLEKTHAFTVTNAGVMGWARDTLVFDVNYSGCSVSAGTLDTAIDNASDLWNSVSTARIKIKRGASVSNSASSLIGGTYGANPIIACSTDFETDTSQSANAVIGVGANAYSSGVINAGYIVLNSNANATAAIDRFSTISLSDTIAHEMGHVLGFGHSGISAALMYYAGSNRTELRLHRDDADAITMLYPRREVGGGSQAFGCGTLHTIARKGSSHLAADLSNEKSKNSHFPFGFILGLGALWAAYRYYRKNGYQKSFLKHT